jgi:Caspase domain
MNKFLFTLFLNTLLTPFFLKAQVLGVVWDKKITKVNHRIYDIIQTTNDQWVGVGESISTDGQSYGELYFFDNTGNCIKTERYGTGKQGFRAIAEQPQEGGVLVLVGWSAAKGQGSDAWLMRLKYDGRVIQDTTLGTLGTDIFEKVDVLKNGTIVAAGYKDRDKNKGIWLCHFKQKGKIEANFEIGEGLYKEVLAVYALDGNRYMICGNTKTEDACMEIFEGRNSKKTEKYGGKQSDIMMQVSRTYDENILMSGETWSKGAAESNAWLIELTPAGDTLQDKAYGDARQEKSVGAMKTQNARYSLVVEYLKRNKELVLMQGDEKKNKTQPIEDGAKFEVKKVFLVSTSPMQFCVAGNILGRKGGSDGFRLMLMQDDYTATKAIARLECSNPDLVDDDKMISPDEGSALKMMLTNTGDADIMEAAVKVTVRNPVTGLIHQNGTKITFIPKNGKKEVLIPINGTPQLVDGTAVLDISIISNGQVLCSKIVTIKCTTRKAPSSPTIVNWEYPKPSDNKNGTNYRSNTPQYRTQLTIISDKPVTNKDVKIKTNGSVLEDSKAGEINLTNPIIQNDRYIYTITVDVPLTKGVNEVSIGVFDGDGALQETIPLKFEYGLQKPTLHVLAIAPAYNDLKYNKKDAEDLEKILLQQGESGMYERVNLTRLTTKEETSLSYIRGAFEELANKWESAEADRIAETDVVMVFFSGHGKLVKNELRLIPSDFRANSENATSVHYKNDVLAYLNKIKCKKIVLLDACHSGAAKTKADVPKADDVNNAVRELNRTMSGLVTLTSCSGDEVSFEDSEWENGAFSEAFIEALSGKADVDNDKLISLGELYDYLKKRVLNLVQAKMGAKTTQTPSIPQDDFEKSLKFWRVAQ